MVGWGANQFASMLVFYQQSQDFSQIQVTSMLGIYVAGLVPALLVGGRFSDRFGRKGTSLAALLITIVASAAMTFGGISPVPIFAGRLLAGIATGAAMAAATSWVKELSQAPWDPEASVGTGARRASLFTAAGFWLGPVASGLLANFAPWPEILPYAVHILLCLPLMVLLSKVPGQPVESALRADSVTGVEPYISPGARRRFHRVVLPSAPWVFGAGTLGFAVVPSLFPELDELALVYSTIAVALTLGCGVAVQPLARRLDSVRSARATVTALGASFVGLLVAVCAGWGQWPWLGLVACCLLGAGYGLMLVAGLLETQRLSAPQRLGVATGKFYTLAYAGFLAPTVLAFLTLWAPLLQLLLAVSVLAVFSLILVAANTRTGLSQTPTRTSPHHIEQRR